ncbi:uncharacterized conserved protein [Zymobacter palmae]|uniref:Uncharacterized conserved protein n=1 Tax=Zymobacter palmae TaxID=33074 RepID=A0A348HGK4_9GAMM|nr:uncharacterized conserved protein [Zymobacter palmae]
MACTVGTLGALARQACGRAGTYQSLAHAEGRWVCQRFVIFLR